ncbi:hypothetical protein E8E12_002681 [Didymella heteroderae]|uniref:F-box domain-containing protein n=1 Tax=Didymella heteroderae TaxID=1769908 RepID=A0A9P4WHN9_9PLEO|nr:hypothetical protein E8E12_002681 [Didymella heteroderae]
MTQIYSRSLPTEILAMVLEYVPLEDCKQFRSANREYRDIATPFCFQTLAFDISVASLRNLERVTWNDKLRLYTQTLVLQRRQQMRNFHSEVAWVRCSSLANDPDSLPVEMENVSKTDHANQYALPTDQLSVPCNAKRALYDRYERERKAADAEIRSLADQLYFRRSGCDYREKVHPHNGQGGVAERFDLARFDETLTKFAKLEAFIHKPLALSAEPWVTEWQGIRLDPYTIDDAYDEDCRKDDGREAFHLSCALRALGWAKPSLTNFTSVTLHVEGPAFWGPHRLQRLWAGKGHDDLRSLREISNDAVDADTDASMISQIDFKIEEFTRQLVLMENAVHGLSHVDCSVSDDEENGGLFTAAGPLFEYLRVGSNLRRVRLAFGWMVDGHVLPELWTLLRGRKSRSLSFSFWSTQARF